MRRFALDILILACAPLALLPSLAAAETIGGNPGPQYNYICPHADGKGALDCYFDAVEHLYTMCRNVKAIEILEYGYEDSREGVNNAKYEFCVDKQKLNMDKPYKAALKEAALSKQAVEGVRSLQENWLVALHKIQWSRGESDDMYKARLARAYDEFREKITGIRTIVALVREKTSPIASAQAKPAIVTRTAVKARAHKAPARSAARRVKAAPAAAATQRAGTTPAAATTQGAGTTPAAATTQGAAAAPARKAAEGTADKTPES